MAYRVFYINDLRQATKALTLIKGSSLISVDLEGALSRNGEISLLQIGLYGWKRQITIFVFDILELGLSSELPQVLDNGLREILENKALYKLMYDCRKDSDALYHQIGVTLRGVIDLQVLEVMIRKHKVGYPPRFVRGLSTVILKEGLSDANAQVCEDQAKSLYDPKRGGSLQVWNVRPLPPILINYAAQDVYLILVLYSCFTSNFVSDLLGLSVSAARLNESRGRRHKTFNNLHPAEVNFDLPPCDKAPPPYRPKVPLPCPRHPQNNRPSRAALLS
eukprot:CAMPEP_0174260780 /NCGR_PEP_ID=MMETSP0439-20130205/10503_1 /TAXON_ID=0 /ORGANISM="Stereomyxa ramosa, Strain Chinc5" /LENGTH=276 /DNA_ID=CAMNT_0015345107 /DNA_START=45 /DNA_END=877 /DNA_ORIENTATION=-